MAKLNKETQAYKNKLMYIREYNKKSQKVTILFNTRTEMYLIDWLKDKAKSTYIKALIKKDMEQQEEK